MRPNYRIAALVGRFSVGAWCGCCCGRVYRPGL